MSDGEEKYQRDWARTVAWKVEVPLAGEERNER